MWEPDEQLLWVLKKLNMDAELLMNRVYEDMGLTAAQGAVLLFILEYPDGTLCSTNIHRILGVARPTVSGLLKRLREKGYIEFRPGPKDDRQKIILVTPTARLLKEALDLRMLEMEHRVLNGITPRDEQTLRSCFRQMDRNLRACRNISG